MIEWQDEGIIIAMRKHGDHHALTHIFTKDRGNHAGMIKYAFSKKNRGRALVGNQMQAGWSARLSNQLGQWELEIERPFAAALMHVPQYVAMLQCMSAMLHDALPEHLPYPDLYQASIELLEHLSANPTELEAKYYYGMWEHALLMALGYRLDLQQCAATGAEDDLCYISPKTGRAVSKNAGEAYKNKLLPLPMLLQKSTEKPPLCSASVIDLLHVSGYFLERWAFANIGRPMPAMRAQITKLAKETA